MYSKKLKYLYADEPNNSINILNQTGSIIQEIELIILYPIISTWIHLNLEHVIFNPLYDFNYQ